jgi:hypothetical protein
MTADEVFALSLGPPIFLIVVHPLQMRELGFDGYAIDFVECPHAMRGFLMRECQLQRTVRPAPLSRELYQCFIQAIALQSGRLDLARAMELVSRTGGGNYIVGKTMNIVTRSQYGRRLPQNLTRGVREARTLAGSASMSYLFFFFCDLFLC